MQNNGHHDSNRFEMINFFCDETAGELTRMEAVVWCQMWRWARNSKRHPLRWVTSISCRQLAVTLNANRQTIQRAIWSLMDQGLLVRLRNGRQTWKASQYLIYPNIDPTRKKDFTPREIGSARVPT